MDNAPWVAKVGARRQAEIPGIADPHLKQVGQAPAAGSDVLQLGGIADCVGDSCYEAPPGTSHGEAAASCALNLCAGQSTCTVKEHGASRCVHDLPVGGERRDDVYIQLRGDHPVPGRPRVQHRLAEHVVQQYPQSGGRQAVAVPAQPGTCRH